MGTSPEEKLSTYFSKRKATNTPEPFTSTDTADSQLVFVIQKHQATALHYDFRLEVDGVMSSWAIPKGPTLDPSVKRLALQTEDHPIDYRHFEGVIPQGQYGAGTVMLWDEGTYLPEIEVKGKRMAIKDKEKGSKVMEEGLAKGELKFFLKGERLRGSFALIKTKGFGGRDNAWLIIKHYDAHVSSGYDAKAIDVSIKTGKKFKDIV